jgi:hypothetical protein
VVYIENAFYTLDCSARGIRRNTSRMRVYVEVKRFDDRGLIQKSILEGRESEA